MAEIPAVVTDDARMYWPMFFGGLLGINSPASAASIANQWNPIIRSFKMGEGGWQNPGPTPRVPSSSLRYESGLLGPPNALQDLDAAVDAYRIGSDLQRYPSNGRFVFSKLLAPGSITFEGESTLRINCLLDFSDANDDGFGNFPQFWEIGVFADHPTVIGQQLMVAYGTFPKEVKNGGIQLENVVRISF